MQMFLNPGPKLEINEYEFKELRLARQTLIDAFSLEEKWEIVIFNYQELERELLVCATEHAVREVRGYKDMFMLNAPLTPRVVNLLTATRLYIDQVPQHLSKNALDPIRIAYKSECSRHYDESFDFRFMEALRNYVQHKGIPVHMVSHGGEWVNFSPEKRKLEFSTVIKSQKKYFAEDSNFKKSVLKEMPDSVNIIECARSYIERLSKIHDFVRTKKEKFANNARLLIEESHKKYLALSETSVMALEAISVNENEEINERVPLLLNWDDVRLSLVKRNPVLNSLAASYVTSRSFKK